jgi:hypothetical protein
MFDLHEDPNSVPAAPDRFSISPLPRALRRAAAQDIAQTGISCPQYPVSRLQMLMQNRFHRVFRPQIDLQIP